MNLFSISITLFQKSYIHGITQYVIFGDWLFALSIILWSFVLHRETVVACLLLGSIAWCTTLYSFLCRA